MNRIQKKIWMLATVVLSIMAIIWIALTYYNQKTQDQYNDILQRYLRLNEVTISSQQLIMDLNNYLIKPSPANLEQLAMSKEKIRRAKYEVFGLRNSENDFALTNYTNLIDSLIETTDRSLMFQSVQETEASAKEFSEATRISAYISDMSLTLLDTELKTYDRIYRGIIEQSVELKKLGIWVMLLITVLLLIITYWFSRSITKPVWKLTQAANELASGRFDLQIEVKSDDEISFLAKTFDHMRININNLISEIQEKAQLEHELQQNKLLLKESQLRTLQSQINPHFLFNTLNTLSKKAYLEGSEETSDLLVSVAGLLRYNLKHLEKSVTLYEEVIVLKQYMDIQKARFTDRVQFHMDIEDTCLNVSIPGLTLQPIVENAVVHGIEPKEDGGVIWFRIKDDQERVRIEIEDDGLGMPEHKIKQILEEQLVETDGQSTGIGFSNVVKRLRLFYSDEDVIDIESGKGTGTKVVLKIPKTRRIEKHEKAPDC
ncbi:MULTISPECIES: sensor histidine kinase [unclassified Bacillus (in: firmicutes)]|uniref:sensor histidine kinase n=1 Tax=unclassified Bacillus (in: firmicutes) TaxID=185979 RepID=UPI0008EC1841|nr:MULTISPECIES: sensor histidine kinase [unclassified Bacillus (in: firmicutes)]SFB14301.1 Histidine kinase-, DNA gyrase B-, and HSP90-like ATPase [Bacillus sp. UNCCL13]SFQ89753.1 Histidine kinase-, DNA gyrase B-, and HSP90-like ATPase [Bacillus sp. cl95]